MKTITLLVIAVFITGVFGHEIKSVSVKKGESVNLYTDTELQRDDVIEWKFGDKVQLIAKLDKEANTFRIYDDVFDVRFRERLKINTETGDLTITNITTGHTGDYELGIKGKGYTSKTFIVSVIGDEVKSVSVKKGKSVTLYTDTELQRDDVIEWKFGDEQDLIAKLDKKTNKFRIYAILFDGRFRERLKINNETGDLTIRDITTGHTGYYQLGINGEKITKTFIVSVFGDEVKSVSVKKGESVTLYTDTELQRDDVIEWKFGDEQYLIAKLDKRTNTFRTYPYVFDVRFRERLKINSETGDLTITNITTGHLGDYQLGINGEKITKTFIVNTGKSPKLEDSVIQNNNVTNIKVDDEDQSSGLSSGVIAGLCVFLLVLFVALAVAVFLYKRLSRSTGNMWADTTINEEETGKESAEMNKPLRSESQQQLYSLSVM